MEFTNTPPEEIEETKQIIAEKIFQGKRLTQNERGYVYFLLTGEHEPVKRSKGRPSGAVKEERNIDLFIKHVDGADHIKSGIGVNGYYSAIRAGKKAFWEKYEKYRNELESRLRTLNMAEYYTKNDTSEDPPWKKDMLNLVYENEASEELKWTKDMLRMVDDLMTHLRDRGQTVRGPGWYCKKNTPK